MAVPEVKKESLKYPPFLLFLIQHLTLIFFSSFALFPVVFQPTDPHTYPYRDAIKEKHTATMHAPWQKENTKSFGPLVPENLTNMTFIFLGAIERHLLKVCSFLALRNMKYSPCSLELNLSINKSVFVSLLVPSWKFHSIFPLTLASQAF